MSNDPRTAKVGEIWRYSQNLDDGSAMGFEGPVVAVAEHYIGIGQGGYLDLMARPYPNVVTETWEKLADAPAPKPVVGQIYLATVCGVEDVPVRCVEDSPIEWMLLLADGCSSCGFGWHASESVTDWRPASVIETAELERLRGEAS